RPGRADKRMLGRMRRRIVSESKTRQLMKGSWARTGDNDVVNLRRLSILSYPITCPGSRSRPAASPGRAITIRKRIKSTIKIKSRTSCTRPKNAGRPALPPAPVLALALSPLPDLTLHVSLSLLCEPLVNPPIEGRQATRAKGNRPGLLHQGGFLLAELCFVAFLMFLPEGGWPLLSTLDLRLVPGLVLFSPRRTGQS